MANDHPSTERIAYPPQKGVWTLIAPDGRQCLACEKERAASPAYKAKALERQRRTRAAKRSQVSI